MNAKTQALVTGSIVTTLVIVTVALLCGMPTACVAAICLLTMQR